MSDASYPYPDPATLPPARPVVVSVLAIIGIVFGSLGLLCGGAGLLSAVAMTVLKTKIVANTPVQPVQIALGVVSFLLSGMLLIASIGSLSLKAQSRQLMVFWALVDIVYDTAKLGITLMFIVPSTTQALAASTPNGVAVARGMMIGSGVAFWLLTVAYAAIVWFFFQSKDVVAAFVRGSVSFDPLMQPTAPPPPPGI